MKKIIATFFRHNPQLKSGGYETTIEIEARTIASAKKKAENINSYYGSIQLLKVEPKA